MIEILKMLPVHLNALESTPLFHDFNIDEIIKFLIRFEQYEFKSGDIIFHEGAQSTNMSILLRGKVSVYKKETVISTLEAPAVMGEIGLFTETPRNATVKADGDALTLIITLEKIRAFFMQEPELGYRLHRNVILCLSNKINNDNQHTLSLYESLLQKDAEILNLKEGIKLGYDPLMLNKRGNVRVTIFHPNLCKIKIDDSIFLVRDLSLSGLNIYLEKSFEYEKNNWYDGAEIEGYLCLLGHSDIPFLGIIKNCLDNCCGIEFSKKFSVKHEEVLINKINDLNRLEQVV